MLSKIYVSAARRTLKDTLGYVESEECQHGNFLGELASGLNPIVSKLPNFEDATSVRSQMALKLLYLLSALSRETVLDKAYEARRVAKKARKFGINDYRFRAWLFLSSYLQVIANVPKRIHFKPGDSEEMFVRFTADLEANPWGALYLEYNQGLRKIYDGDERTFLTGMFDPFGLISRMSSLGNSDAH